MYTKPGGLHQVLCGRQVSSCAALNVHRSICIPATTRCQVAMNSQALSLKNWFFWNSMLSSS
jgi:hypothetical protein